MTPNDVLESLRAADDAVRQGTVAYERHCRSFYEPVDVEAEVRATVAQARAESDDEGHIFQVADRARTLAKIHNGRRDFTEAGSLSWTSDGRVRYEKQDKAGAPPYIDIDEGRFVVTVFPEAPGVVPRTVMLQESRGDMEPLRPGHTLWLTAGPCFPLGRGLSRLEGLRVSEDAEGIRVEGAIREWSVRARIDPDHGGIARRIDAVVDVEGCFGATVFTLSEFWLSTDGVWMPGCAVTEQWKADGTLLMRDERRFRAADFRAPDPERFTYRFQPGERVEVICGGEAIMFESLPADLTDPDAILTRARERQAMRRAFDQAPEASQGPR